MEKMKPCTLVIGTLAVIGIGMAIRCAITKKCKKAVATGDPAAPRPDLSDVSAKNGDVISGADGRRRTVRRGVGAESGGVSTVGGAGKYVFSHNTRDEHGCPGGKLDGPYKDMAGNTYYKCYKKPATTE